MKKQFILFASVLTIGGITMLTSCKKEDTTAPTLTVNGNSAPFTMSQSLPATAGNGTWTNPSATANDDEDGDISSQVSVSGTVDANTKGTYTLTYSVSDAAGNTTSIVVTVNIVNDADGLANANYQVHDSISPTLIFNYPQVVTASTTINGRIHFNKFADYQNNSNIYASATGSGVGATITVPFQSASNIGTLNETHEFTGNGTVTSTTQWSLVYTDHNVTQSASATDYATFTHP